MKTSRIDYDADGKIKKTTHSRYSTDSYARKYNNLLYDQSSIDIKGTVLDIGSKTNMSSKYNNEQVEEYIPIDVRPEGGDVVKADAGYLPIEDDSIDTIILSEVLEHVPVPDVEGILSEIRRVLVSTGIILANVPFVFSLHGLPNDYVRYSPYGLINLFETHGFRAEVYCGGGYTDVLLHVLSSPLHSMKTYLDIELPLLLFSLVHYPVYYLGVVMNRLINAVFLKNPVHNQWFVTQLVKARPE